MSRPVHMVLQKAYFVNATRGLMGMPVITQ